DATMDVLVDTKAVVYAETHRCSRHELHDSRCSFARNCVWLPAGFFVDDRLHQLNRHPVDGCVIFHPTHREVSWLADLRPLRSCSSCREQNDCAHLCPVQATASRPAASVTSCAPISSSR